MHAYFPGLPADSPGAGEALTRAKAAVGGYAHAYSGVTSGPPAFGTLLAVDVGATVPLMPAQVTPDLSPLAVAQRWATGATIQGYVALPWTPGFAGVAAMCADGVAAAGCVTAFTPASPLQIHTGMLLGLWEGAGGLRSGARGAWAFLAWGAIHCLSCPKAARLSRVPACGPSL